MKRVSLRQHASANTIPASSGPRQLHAQHQDSSSAGQSTRGADRRTPTAELRRSGWCQVTATTDKSHGKVRPRVLRLDRYKPSTPASEAAAPYRDPSNGRFGAGNPGGRLRQIAALGKLEAESLLRLKPDAVAPWLRGQLADAQRYVQGLVDSLPVKTSELLALCGDEAKARLLANAALSEGSREGVGSETAAAWRKESREWMREARQTVLTRKAIARDTLPEAAENATERLRREAREAFPQIGPKK